MPELIKGDYNYVDTNALSFINIAIDSKIVIDSSSVNVIELLLITSIHSPICNATNYFYSLFKMLAFVVP